jgi:hypothetical protein
MTNDDMQGAKRALRAWLQSQEVEGGDAVGLFIELLAEYLRENSRKHALERNLNRAVRDLRSLVRCGNLSQS